MDAIDAMGDALKVLGDKFQIMEVFLPEILLATDAFKAGLKVLEPELMKTIDAGSFQEKPKVVIGTVKGDVHPNLSILDLLFCCGPEAGEMI